MADPVIRQQEVNKVIAEYLAAVEAGRAPDGQELLGRHPHLAEELTSFLRDQENFGRFAAGLPLPADPAAEAPTLAPSGSLGSAPTGPRCWRGLEPAGRAAAPSASGPSMPWPPPSNESRAS